MIVQTKTTYVAKSPGCENRGEFTSRFCVYCQNMYISKRNPIRGEVRRKDVHRRQISGNGNFSRNSRPNMIRYPLSSPLYTSSDSVNTEPIIVLEYDQYNIRRELWT